MNLFPLHLIDFYKSGHIYQYPAGTEYVYSNFTPRSSKYAPVLPTYNGKVVFFGLQGVVKWLLIDLWNNEFFNKPIEQVVRKFKRRMDKALGDGAVSTKHIEALHKLDYLPIEIKALPEGSLVDIKVPVYTIVNTLPEFYWLTNYLETMLSAECWKSIRNATIAYEYRKLLEEYAEKTGAPKEFVSWQAHDFSMRGMSGVHDAAQSGAAHLVSFLGTDTVPAIDYVEEYYNAEDEFVGGSVPATEHSVMCMGGKSDEVATIRRIITEVYPKGIVSVVSDTWNFWNVITNTATILKPEIMSRKTDALGNAKVVFRPDSGDPVRVICGDADIIDYTPYLVDYDEDKIMEWVKEDIVEKHSEDVAHGEYGGDTADGYFKLEGKVYKMVVELEYNRYDKQYYYLEYSRIKSCEEVELTPEQKGAVECLWEVFGGTVNDKGYKVLDSHVGLIYGDSITLERAKDILEGLERKGFASCNIVFGVGSYTYQYGTRDDFGCAMKATWGVVNGEEREIFKDPVTDNGTKKSAKGLLQVQRDLATGNFVLYDQQTKEQEQMGELRTVFKNGTLIVDEALSTIRERLQNV